MRKGGSRTFELAWFDYFLTGAASCLAAFSAGFGLGVPQIAVFFVGWIIMGTILGAVLQRAVPKKMVAADGIFYALCAIFAMYYDRELNSILPGEGFPDQLRVAGWLCWMLVFGSCFMWRDSTVLFQAVPGIAIFGLVGTWDTFRASPFLFFVFLLCFATLFARAHGRGMMVRARDSGFTSNVPGRSPPGAFLAALKRGPWKWMAGPEWALLSALVVVLISLIGGPFLQFSLQGVSGKVLLPPPPTTAMRQNYFGSSSSVSSTTFRTDYGVSVGTGPHGELAKIPVFKVQYNGSVYLLAHTCHAFNGRRWTPTDNLAGPTGVNLAKFNLSTLSAKPARIQDFSVFYVSGIYDSVPVPDGLQEIEDVPRADMRMDGTVSNLESLFGGNGMVLSGKAAVPMAMPVEALYSPLLADYTDPAGRLSTPRVRDLAKQVIQGAKTDYEKAKAIRTFISSRCTYDLDAAPVPQGQDAVDYFLFSSRRGYCDLFASAMTVMAQSVGLPSRFAIGWAPFTQPAPDKDHWVTYYDTDYHCWSEVFFKNVGWVIFDATNDAAEAPGAGRGSVRSSTPWYLQSSVGFGLASLGLIGLVALALSIANKLRFRLPILGLRRSEIERIYGDLLRTMEFRTGKPKRPSQTPFEYLDTITPYLDGSYEAVKSATDAFVAAYYGREDPNPEMVQVFREKARLAKDVLKLVKRPKEQG